MSLRQMFPAGTLPDKYKHTTHETPTEVPTVCPECEGALFLDDTAEVILQDRDERELERRPATVLFCSGCEYAEEWGS